jgi:hypothetical protein
MSIFKSLAPGDISIIPFPAYYKYSFSYISGSTSDSSGVKLSYASQFDTSSKVTREPNNSQELYDAVVQSFYSDIPYAAYGTKTTSYIPSSSIYVINIAQNLFGEKVLPGSFSVSINNTQSYDDGIGNIIVSSSTVGGVIGRIFYDKGVVLLKPTSSVSLTINNQGVYISESSTIGINFSSSMLFYENSYKIKIMPGEFLHALSNITVTQTLRTSSINNQRPIDLQSSGSLLPYVTTIGLYNDQNELLLVAKPSVPVQRTSEVPQTFIIKFDV